MTERTRLFIEETLKLEGNYCMVSGDAGGETYRGIARKMWPKWEGWKIVDSHKPLKYNQRINDERLDNMIVDFYYERFAKPIRLDQIPNPVIAYHLYDFGVNAGVKQAVKLLQRAINNVINTNIAVDGVIGPVTISYCTKESVAKEYIKLREKFYKDIVNNKPSQKKFLQGWLNRVARATAFAEKL